TGTTSAVGATGTRAARKSGFISESSYCCADSIPRFSTAPGAFRTRDHRPIRVFREQRGDRSLDERVVLLQRHPLDTVDSQRWRRRRAVKRKMPGVEFPQRCRRGLGDLADDGNAHAERVAWQLGERQVLEL